MSVLKTKEVRTVFHFCMSNRFKPLQDQLENNDTNIDTMILMKCGKTRDEVFGRKKTQHSKWVSVNTMKKLDVRNAKKEPYKTSKATLKSSTQLQINEIRKAPGKIM